MADEDDTVGYKRPPRRTQFKPGRSGNPTGKNKGARNIATELNEILSEQVTIAEKGTLKTMSKQRALASALIAAAIDGDLRATAIVLSHVTRAIRGQEEDHSIENFVAAEAHRKRKRRL